jgi:hypothetical protein
MRRDARGGQACEEAERRPRQAGRLRRPGKSRGVRQAAEPVHRKSINRLRAIVQGAFPELEERMRWMQVGYLVSKKDVCGIYPASDHVNLSFWQGSALSDPKGLLEGTGKGMRHIKIFKVEDVGERPSRPTSRRR